ncbi:amino acid adenylation domain-containing protein [Rhodococcus opacus]|uniref:non-ribosomal peptide synthetase n=1 Tax=Rhodococcus opacus TaxID=37919 RepID=UPI001C9DB5E8|nr:non-ribosomal peptide synthetase [Rhodococcus opacus]QZS56023.1 amino acid adenylation domain-containing protein [Rhodococcus opacus]
MSTQLTHSKSSGRLVPLTAAQQAIWLAQQLTPEVPYVIAQYVDLSGPIEVEKLCEAHTRAMDELGAEVVLVDVDGHPYQRERIRSAGQVLVLDFRAERDPAEFAREWMRRDCTVPLAMGDDSLVFSRVLRVGDDRVFWYARAHHLALDGYAAMLLMQRTAQWYVAALGGGEPGPHRVVGPEQLSRADRDYRSSGRFDADREYWAGLAPDLPPVVSLAGRSAAPRPAVRVTGDPMAVSSMPMPGGRSVLDRTAVLVAAFAVYLARMTDVDDVMVSLPVTARTTGSLRAAAGSVSNVVPLALPGIGATTVEEAIGIARAALIAALRHQRYRREDIGRERGTATGELASFGPVLNLMLFEPDISLGAVTGRVHVLTTGPTADLAVNIYPGSTDLMPRIDFEANPALYGERELSSHHRRFTHFLQTFVTVIGDDCAVADLELFLPGEREVVTPARGPADVEPATLTQLLAAATGASGERIAVRDRGRSFSYRDLDRHSTALAGRLLGAGIGPEDLVAVAVPRSYDSVVAVWAVAAAGGAYVPVDPTYPRARIQYMLDDCTPVVGLTSSDTRGQLPAIVRWLTVDLDTLDVPPPRPVRPVRRENAAYVIYTSGSTGAPKGVVVTHDGLANLAQEIRDNYALSATSRVLHFASPSFDTALVEVLAAALAGATLVVTPPDVVGGHELADLLRDEHVTHVLSTPSALATVNPDGLDDVELVLVGGEACPPELVTRWAHHRTMRNAYGPTETTCSVTLSSPMAPDRPVTIGALMRGVDAVVLDRRLRPLPSGAVGELYLGTPGLARGYAHRGGMTAGRFVANPFGKPGSRLFRTGDLVRWTPEATLEYVGRSDDQVKVRGFRIELSEIDTALRGHPDVEFATTVVHNRAGDALLVSYVLLRTSSEVTPAMLRAAVAQLLPDYMVPVVITVLDDVPLTPTKKLDRAALPAPEFGSVVPAARPPRTPNEHAVAGVLTRVLCTDVVDAESSFFDLGGDSLSATRVIAALNADFGAQLGVRDLFEFPTVAALAQLLAEEHPESGELSSLRAFATQPLPQRVPLAPAQQFLDRTAPRPALYNLPFTVTIRGVLDIEALRDATTDVLDRHHPLRTVYPDSADGPCQRFLEVTDAVPDLTPVHVTASELAQHIRWLLHRGFDVRTEPPLRATLFASGPEEHLLACVIHHISADGWSLAVLARDLLTAYASRAAGTAPRWAPLPAQYPHYSLWRHDLLGDDADPGSLTARQIEFWRAELAGLPGELTLPADRPRPQRWTYAAGRLSFAIDEQTHRALLHVAHARRATMFTVLHSALVLLLARLSSQRTIAIGTPTAGRTHPDLDDVVGMFVNTLVLGSTVDPDTSLADLLDQSRDTELNAFAHADVQFEHLVDVLDPPRSPSLHPFFQVALSLNNFTAVTLDSDGLEFEIAPQPLDIAKCDLHFHFTDHHNADGDPAGIDCELVYSADLFDRDTVAGFLPVLRAILAEAVA